MTILERQALDTARVLLAALTKRQITHYDYIELLGNVRDLVYALENKDFGCPTGIHRSECLCKPAVKGFRMQHYKRRKS